MRRRAGLCCATLAWAMVALVARADEAAEERLRAQLKQSATEVLSLKEANAQLRLDVQRLEKELAQEAPEPGAGEEDLQRKVGELERSAQALEAQSARQQAALEQWKQAYEQLLEVARQRDAAAKDSAAMCRGIREHVERCERDNAALLSIGNELLERYRGKGVLDTVREREPLLGLQRLEYERLAQDYSARMREATVKPASEGVAPVAACEPGPAEGSASAPGAPGAGEADSGAPQ